MLCLSSIKSGKSESNGQKYAINLKTLNIVTNMLLIKSNEGLGSNRPPTKNDARNEIFLNVVYGMLSQEKKLS